MKPLVERYPDGGWVDSTVAARLNGILGGHGYAGDVEALGLPDEAEAVVRESLAPKAKGRLR